MFLNQCIASKPGLLNNKVIDFDRNITVICGDSDSGKTLLSRSIIDLIFNIKNENPILGQAVWDDFYMNCLFSIGNEKYKTVKNNSTTQIHLIRKKEETLIFDSSFDSEISTEFAVSRYVKFFSSLVFSVLGYMKTPVDDFPEIDMFNEITGFFLNDNSGFFRTFRILENYFSNTAMGRNLENILTKEILECENKIRLIEKNMDLSRLKEQKKAKLNNEKLNLLNEKKIIEIKAESLRKNLENISSLENLYSECNRFDEKIAELKFKIENEKKLKTSINDLQSKVKKIFPQFAEMNSNQRENFEKIQNAYKYIKNLDDEIIKTEDHIFSKMKFYKRLSSVSLVFSAAAASFIYFQKFIKLDRNIEIISISIIGGILLYILTFSLIKWFSLSRFKKAAELKKEREDSCRSFFEILKENNLKTEDLTVDEIYELLLQYYEEFGFYTEHEEEISILNNSLHDGETFIAFNDELALTEKELSRCVNEAGRLIKKIGLYTDSDHRNYPISQARSFFEDEAEEFSLELRKIDDLIEQIDAELGHSESNEENGTGFEKEISEYNDRHIKLKAYDRNISFVLDVFRKSIENRKTRILSEISQNTLLLFNEITMDLYGSGVTRHSIEDYIMTGKTPSLENKSLPNIIELSMKIAVTDYLEGAGLLIPLIIDEPTMYLDKNRISRLKKVLNDFSKKRQIVIFTQDDSTFKKFGKQVNL